MGTSPFNLKMNRKEINGKFDYIKLYQKHFQKSQILKKEKKKGAVLS